MIIVFGEPRPPGMRSRSEDSRLQMDNQTMGLVRFMHPSLLRYSDETLNLYSMVEKRTNFSLQYSEIPALLHNLPGGTSKRSRCPSNRCRMFNPMMFVPPFLPVGLQFLETLRHHRSRTMIQTDAYMRLLQAGNSRSESNVKDESPGDYGKRRCTRTDQDPEHFDQLPDKHNPGDKNEG